MKLNRCPVCHSHLHLDALTNDDAARQMLALLAPLAGGLGRALVAYVGLFRPAKRDLSFSRALKLANEALALSGNRDRLRVALEQTVTSLQGARAEGQTRPLTNHNYLKKVLTSLDTQAVLPTNSPKQQPSLEIKRYGQPESLAETKAKFEAQMARFTHKSPNKELR